MKHMTVLKMFMKIVTSLIELAQSEDIVYAVPGHPRVAETTTVKLLEYSHFNKDISVKVLGEKVLLMTFLKRLM